MGLKIYVNGQCDSKPNPNAAWWERGFIYEFLVNSIGCLFLSAF